MFCLLSRVLFISSSEFAAGRRAVAARASRRQDEQLEAARVEDPLQDLGERFVAQARGDEGSASAAEAVRHIGERTLRSYILMFSHPQDFDVYNVFWSLFSGLC